MSKPDKRVTARPIRIIARLDVKAPNLIKAIQLEGLRIIGDPNVYAKNYYDAGADEIVYMDVVASLYERNSLTDIVQRTTEDVFVPMTVGGGVRSVEDARQLLANGADKIALNTAAIRSPELVTDISRKFGSQATVLSIEAKRSAGGWEAYTDNGREHTNQDVVEWAKSGAERGAGEILLTSVDREGTRSGFDVGLVKAVTEAVSIPVIASGGFGKPEHLFEVTRDGGADAVAFADALHYNRYSIAELNAIAREAGLAVRNLDKTT
ncbi:MAG: imidazole glycerol phosphate synthase cyclase subunit [Pseudomonadota bacterium]